MTSRIPILQYITQKLFNFERVLHDLNVDDCASSSYIYDPACHVITGEFNIIKNIRCNEFFLFTTSVTI